MRPVRLLLAIALACGATAALPIAANATFFGQTIIADLNNDGIPDRVLLGQVGKVGTPCTMTVQFGTKVGTFGAPTVHQFSPPNISGFCPDIGLAVRLGDDKRADLVTSFSSADIGALLVFHDFQLTGTFGGVIDPDFMRTVDLNGDGRKDIIIASNQVATLATFINNPDGTLTRGPSMCEDSDPQYALADFNGDGGQDILLSRSCGIGGNVPLRAEVMFGNGQAPVVLATNTTGDPFAKFTVFATDVNYDGIPDAGVSLTGHGTTTVQYFVSDGHGAFSPMTGAPSQVITADLNNDGIPDQATLGQVGATTTCTVTVRPGTASGTFGPPRVHSYTTLESLAPFCPNIGAAVKLGTDRRPDLVTGFSFGFRDLMVVHAFTATAIFPGIVQPDFIRAADLNADGRPDIIEGGSQEEELATFTNNVDGTITPGAIDTCAFQHGNGPQYVLADFNGDGGQDIFLSDVCPTAQFPVQAQVFFGNGQAPTILEAQSTTATQFTVFALDLDYNGVPDAGIVEITGGVTTVRFLHNDGLGHFTATSAP
jgi:hypothetical protein